MLVVMLHSHVKVLHAAELSTPKRPISHCVYFNTTKGELFKRGNHTYSIAADSFSRDCLSIHYLSENQAGSRAAFMAPDAGRRDRAGARQGDDMQWVLTGTGTLEKVQRVGAGFQWSGEDRFHRGWVPGARAPRGEWQ